MSKILLTGSRGFTGKYISQIFVDAGYDVIGLVENRPKGREVVADLRDKDQLRRVLSEIKPDGVIHLAALSFVGHSTPLDFYDINLLGTLNLLEAMEASDANVKKCIIASSANIYGNPIFDPIPEETHASPVNHYAMSKLAMEYMLTPWFEKFNITIVRPFNYTGPGQDNHFLIPKIVGHYCERKAQIELGNLDVSRDFSDVRDIARYYLALYQLDKPTSKIVNLCSGKVVALSEVIEMMNQISGYKIEVTINSDFVRPNEIKTLRGSSKKLKALADLEPEYTFYETIKHMYDVQNSQSAKRAP